MSIHLVVGASGQVGEHLVRAALNEGLKVVGTYYRNLVPGMQQLDICNAQDVRSLLLKLRPTIVYLPASFVNVDYCELQPAVGYVTNVLGISNVVQAAKDIQAKLIYFSSDYVFDGKAGPYRETDPTNPLCEYGRQKLMAEHYVALHSHDYLIVRTTVVYGWELQRKNFVYRLLKTLKAGQSLKVPVDQIGSPTYAPNLAQAVVKLALSNLKGLYHIVGAERVNRYEFACEAAKVFRLNPGLIQSVATSELGQPAPRPLNAGMLIDKVAAQVPVPLIGYREGLTVMASEGEFK